MSKRCCFRVFFYPSHITFIPLSAIYTRVRRTCVVWEAASDGGDAEYWCWIVSFLCSSAFIRFECVGAMWKKGLVGWEKKSSDCAMTGRDEWRMRERVIYFESVDFTLIFDIFFFFFLSFLTQSKRVECVKIEFFLIKLSAVLSFLKWLVLEPQKKIMWKVSSYISENLQIFHRKKIGFLSLIWLLRVSSLLLIVIASLWTQQLGTTKT